MTDHCGQNLNKIVRIIKVWNILPHLNPRLNLISCCVAVLLMVFSFLDDISLCMVGQVCQWWHQLAGEQDQWKKHVLTRWPSLFQPADKPSTSWQNLYIKMWDFFYCLWFWQMDVRAVIEGRCWKFPWLFSFENRGKINLKQIKFDLPPISSTPCIYSETWNLRDSPEREFLGKWSLIFDVYK